LKSINEEVTRDFVRAWRAGKNTTFQEAFKLIDSLGGTLYNKGAPPGKTLEECVSYDPDTGNGRTEGECSGNVWFTGPIGRPSAFPPPPKLHQIIKAQRAVNKYVVVGGSNSFSSPKHEVLDQNITAHASTDVLAQFLLAIEPGAYLLANGWDERFSRPLGLPVGDAVVEGTLWTRKFASGVVATYDTATGKGNIKWPDGWTP